METKVTQVLSKITRMIIFVVVVGSTNILSGNTSTGQVYSDMYALTTTEQYEKGTDREEILPIDEMEVKDEVENDFAPESVEADSLEGDEIIEDTRQEQEFRMDDTEDLENPEIEPSVEFQQNEEFDEDSTNEND